jgi:hypothetical protein
MSLEDYARFIEAAESRHQGRAEKELWRDLRPSEMARGTSRSTARLEQARTRRPMRRKLMQGILQSRGFLAAILMGTMTIHRSVFEGEENTSEHSAVNFHEYR